MNFLAHLFLSGAPGEQMVGNFMADSVKGNYAGIYSPAIQNGIKLHRAIDVFTDTHAVTLKSKERLRHRYRKYAPVITDIFYDHFLAVHWEEYADTNLPTYADNVYKFLADYYGLMPERSKQFYDYMMKYDILYSYTKIEGIERVMKGMSRRARFTSGMETAAEELLNSYDDFKNEFKEFFPELQAHVHKHLED